ncbi:MAG: SDR family oxidoreductase [Synergistaceae bacterium]|nr:SDR family oxidoreductase [Synergistaceae bacterium]
MINLVDFTGKKIVVAGASSGIGQASAVTLSRLWGQMILVARREDKLNETLGMLEGSGHRYYCADLSNTDVIDGLIGEIVQDCGAIDGLVYSAGVSTARPLKQLTPEILRDVFAVNYFGFIETVRQLTRKGRFNPGMRIVAVSSIASKCGDGGHVAYSGSKAAVDGSVRCIAKELAAKGICINTVAPALTRTAMFEGYIAKYGEDSESYSGLLRRQYLGIVEVQHVANAIAFLMSSAAKFITGICMPVDGGYTSC